MSYIVSKYPHPSANLLFDSESNNKLRGCGNTKRFFENIAKSQNL